MSVDRPHSGAAAAPGVEPLPVEAARPAGAQLGIDSARIDTEVDPTRGVIVHTVSGELTITAAWRAMFRFQRAVSRGVVWDVRGGVVGITLWDIVHLDPRLVRLATREGSDRRVAWVLRSGFEEAVIKLLHLEHPWGQDWKTFTSLGPAARWAGGIAPG